VIADFGYLVMNGIFNMFGPSPIRPIEQHMHKVYHCAKQLYPFFEAVLQEDWPAAALIQDKIAQMEKEADGIKRDLRLHLPAGLFLPVARTDLLELLSAQDRIANKAEDIAGLIMNRKMVIPAPIRDLLMPFLSRCLDAAKQACKAINELDQLLESGFSGNEVTFVEDMIVTLDTIEQDSDGQLATIRHHLFLLETQIPPLDAIFLYKLVQWVGDLADYAQTVGGRLQILIAR
jgi:predicted phosphate transport protein (TIGR00153 family)